MEYGKINMFGRKIRNEEELQRIQENIKQYQETEDVHFIQHYMAEIQRLELQEELLKYSHTIIGTMIYDELHPLTAQDDEKWKNYLLNKVKQLHIK